MGQEVYPAIPAAVVLGQGGIAELASGKDLSKQRTFFPNLTQANDIENELLLALLSSREEIFNCLGSALILDRRQNGKGIENVFFVTFELLLALPDQGFRHGGFRLRDASEGTDGVTGKRRDDGFVSEEGKVHFLSGFDAQFLSDLRWNHKLPFGRSLDTRHSLYLLDRRSTF